MQGDMAIILDMDGVLLQTHHLQALAWERTFKEFFSQREDGSYEAAHFDIKSDYRKFFNGRPEEEGVRDYLSSIGVALPQGSENSEESYDTVIGIGKVHQRYYEDLLADHGPKVYRDSLEAVKRWTNQHVPLGLVSSSTACQAVLRMGNVEIFFDAIVDPQLARKKSLKGKPEPDYLVHSAELLGFRPDQCYVVEDSEAGVRAGKKGGFLRVFGMVHEPDESKEQELLAAGADEIIHSLNDIDKNEIEVNEGERSFF